MNDPRIVHGAHCTWWDSINKIATIKAPGGYDLPCCPNCNGVLFEMPDEATWWKVVDRYEAAGHPGYRTLVEWGRGKCFMNVNAVREAFAAAHSPDTQQ